MFYDYSQQYLTFSLGEEMFAIGILAIREIIEYGCLTEVPMVPPFNKACRTNKRRLSPMPMTMALR